MASSASRKSEQDLVTGGLVENDLIEEIHAWYKHAIEHAMITIFDLPAKRTLNDVETTAWKHFEEMIKSCEQSLFKIAENVTMFFSEIKDDDFEYEHLEKLLDELNKKITNEVDRFFDFKKGMLKIQKQRMDEQDSDIKYPDMPPAKKPRMVAPAAAAAAAASGDDDDDDSDVEFNHLAPGEDLIGGMPSVSKKSPKFGEN